MVMQLPERDELSQTREQLHAQMAIAMGGRVAEERAFKYLGIEKLENQQKLFD